MILLLGGASETKSVATALMEAGFETLVSMATDNELDIGEGPGVTRRTGRLSETGFIKLIEENGVAALVDAAHPFATAAHDTAKNAAKNAVIPYFRLERPGSKYDYDKIHYADDHEHAAQIAAGLGKAVLLTTGSRNLWPYVAAVQTSGTKLVARVLPHAESEDAVKKAGLADAKVIYARGPFTVEENLEVIREHGIGVIVTKDSGAAGGVPEKIESARAAGIDMVIVKRPELEAEAFSTVADLVAAVKETLMKARLDGR
ncbi:MAG: precorrin-6A reductase [Nitrospinae bacterium]|nr:precorrin-6A reductase [Nitrospinota bacterium]